MNPCCHECSDSLKDHPKCKAECNTMLAMKDSSYAKLKLEHQLMAKRLKQVEDENRTLSTELRQMKELACTLQCEVQTLVENCTAELARAYPYMEASMTPYMSQSLQPRNNETMLAELLRVEKAVCARYKAKADTVESLERELAALKSTSSASKRHDMVFNFNLTGRRLCPLNPLSPAEIDAQGRIPGTAYRASGSQCIADTPMDEATLQSNHMHWNLGRCKQTLNGQSD